MPCPSCDDGDDGCCFPYYGHAPGAHKTVPGFGFITSEPSPKEEWPPNFEEDLECPGLGTYHYCLECGSGSLEFTGEEKEP
jgi:hypothetical protein